MSSGLQMLRLNVVLAGLLGVEELAAGKAPPVPVWYLGNIVLSECVQGLGQGDQHLIVLVCWPDRTDNNNNRKVPHNVAVRFLDEQI